MSGPLETENKSEARAGRRGSHGSSIARAVRNRSEAHFSICQSPEVSEFSGGHTKKR